MIQLSRSAGLELQAAGDRAKIRQAQRDVIERCAGGAAAARGAPSALPMLCAPPAFSMIGALAERTHQGEARGELAALDRLDRVLRAEIRAGVHAESDDAAARRPLRANSRRRRRRH